jgi:hypothetical protein
LGKTLFKLSFSFSKKISKPISVFLQGFNVVSVNRKSGGIVSSAKESKFPLKLMWNLFKAALFWEEAGHIMFLSLKFCDARD